MDKYTLNEKQLDQLRMFIRKRGFNDDIVVEEILDHFACKVEELIIANPHMMLDEAMGKAHHSFGVSGFRPVVKAFEKQLESRYRRLFWRSVRQILVSPKYLLVLIPLGYLLLKGIVWTDANGYRHIFGSNDLLIISWIALFIYEVILVKKMADLKFDCYKKAVSVGEFIIGPVMIGFITGTSGSGSPDRNLWLGAAIFTILIIAVLIRQLSFNHILQLAKAELNERKHTLPVANH